VKSGKCKVKSEKWKV